MQRFECNPNQIAADKANQADTETVKFYSYHQSVTEALDIIGAAETLKQQKAILIKPNLCAILFNCRNCDRRRLRHTFLRNR